METEKKEIKDHIGVPIRQTDVTHSRRKLEDFITGDAVMSVNDLREAYRVYKSLAVHAGFDV